jgi:hypothetical protein
MKARQLVHLYLSTDQETFDSGTAGNKTEFAGVPSCMKCSSQQMISGTLTKKSGMLFSMKVL